MEAIRKKGKNFLMIAVDSSDRCSICYKNFLDTQLPCSRLSCTHIFHARCLTRWTANHPSCPLCRRVIVVQQPIKQRLAVHIEDTCLISLSFAYVISKVATGIIILKFILDFKDYNPPQKVGPNIIFGERNKTNTVWIDKVENSSNSNLDISYMFKCAITVVAAIFAVSLTIFVVKELYKKCVCKSSKTLYITQTAPPINIRKTL